MALNRIITASMLVACLSAMDAQAQLTLGSADHVMEITGGISMYYNHRVLREGFTDRRKDRFNLRDAQLQIEGRYRNSISYELQFDVADLGRMNTGMIDPENPGLMDAYITFRNVGPVDVTVGYTKLPYSRSSLVPFFRSPYWQRAQLVRGDLFSRRDVGVTVSSTFLNERAAIYGGIYTGLGELSQRGDNDASGRPEFVGRAEFAWPSRYRKIEIDDRLVPVPMVALGVNARHTDKRQPDGSFLPPFTGGEYGIKVIDGRKSVIGADVSAQYKGLSAQAEAHVIRMEPRNPLSSLYHGLDVDVHEGYVLAGGWYGQLNWFNKQLRTIISARYEQLNINDLARGEERRIGGAVAYQVRDFDTMIKLQYWHILQDEATVDPLKWDEQVRLGVQYLFK